ncbi:DNA distortion polypeptide 1 [Escherichia coli]|uniref:DNA distortion polypeptide 1 n=1 Tax=Escherichia coli TaxID=562 RepID=UPI003A4DA2DF
MKKIQFRVEDEDHDYLLVCLKSIYPDEPNLTVAKGMKLLASALLKSKDKKIEESIIDDNDDFIKTTLYLTATQRSKIEKASIRHGWTISRECRFRIQTTLDNNLDFYDQELLMLNRCRNVVDKIGRNFHYIIVNNQSMLLEKDDFYQDAQKLTFEMRSLKEQFENYIALCKGRTVSNKFEV